MSSKDKFHAADDDDHVAKLLAEDAKKSSIRYASVGLSALLPKRPTGSAPKPNTRFLKHLVQEADTHNAALKKKEELEARIRLRELRHAEREERDSYSGDEHRRKRRRVSPGQPEEMRRRRSHHRSERSRSPRRRERQSHRRRNHHSEHNDDYDNDAVIDRSGEYDHESDRKHKHRGSHSREGRDRNRRSRQEDKEHRLRHHSRSSPRRRSSYSEDKQSRDSNKRARAEQAYSSETESDPLERLVGPLPPASLEKHSTVVRPRGRGAHKIHSSSSNMDARFSSTYDPDLDNNFDSEPDDQVDNDWDMALEALRDRTMWKRKQAERMRDAGWSETDIERWEKSAINKSDQHDTDISQVKWVREGEAREWDKGKEG